MTATKKVMVFGSFDFVHDGHLYFFNQAKSLGKELVVVVARDDTIKKVKGKRPYHQEKERLKHVKAIKLVDRAVLGNLDDKYKIIEDIKPELICLGYDQVAFAKNLKKELKKRRLNIDVVRLNEYKAHIYKSSRIKKANGIW